MPDIAMCHGELDGEACELRDKCYRHVMATPDAIWQTHMIPTALGGDCEYYWPVKLESKRKDSQ